MAVCERCEDLSMPSTGGGHLYLWAPIGHSRAKFSEQLRAAGWDCAPRESNAVVVNVPAQSASRLVDALEAMTTPLEREDVKALFLTESREPSVADFGAVRTLRRYIGETRSAWLIELLQARRLTMHFQPIVSAADTAEIFAYECLMRGTGAGGELIPPMRLLDAAGEADLLFQLDRQAREAAVRQAQAAGIDRKMFINFAPNAIYDPAFCLRTTVGILDELQVKPAEVVFEVGESHAIQRLDQVQRILKFYREKGFLIALDDLGAGYASLNYLHALRPDFIKIDMGLVRGVDTDSFKAEVARRLIETALALDIGVIAEGIETPEEFRWLRGAGAQYLQGYLFGRPQAVPARESPRVS